MKTMSDDEILEKTTLILINGGSSYLAHLE